MSVNAQEKQALQEPGFFVEVSDRPMEIRLKITEGDITVNWVSVYKPREGMWLNDRPQAAQVNTPSMNSTPAEARAVAQVMIMASHLANQLNQPMEARLKEYEERRAAERAEYEERRRIERERRERMEVAKAARRAELAELLKWHLGEKFKLRRLDHRGNMMRATVLGTIERVTEHHLHSISEKQKYMTIHLDRIVLFEMPDPEQPKKWNVIYKAEESITQ